MTIFTKLGTEINAPIDLTGQPRGADMMDEMRWKTEVEALLNTLTTSGSLVYSSKAFMDADLHHDDDVMAWVIGDPAVANNGIYGKNGATGTGNWVRMGDLPYSFIRAFDTGAGDANAIIASSSVPVTTSALILLNIFETNTSGNVTVSFNGATAIPIKTSSGNNPAVGGLIGGMIVAGALINNQFRLISDQSGAAIQAAAEAAQAAAEAAAAAAAGSVANAFASSLANLKAQPVATVFNVWYNGGQWKQLNYADYSAQVLADTAGAMFARSTDDITKVWVREGGYFVGEHAHFDWFHVPKDGTSANAAFLAMLATCAALGIRNIRAAQNGVYNLVECSGWTKASFNIDFNNALVQCTYVAGLQGTRNAFKADVQMLVGGTSIGNLTSGGGLAAAFDGNKNKTNATAAALAATTGYIGKTPGTPVRVSRALVWGSTNAGFASGSTALTTLTLYGKTGAAPASGTDGTILGSITVADVPASLVVKNTTGEFTAGQVLTGAASGATATILRADVSGSARVLYFDSSITGSFQVDELITDPLGGSGTVREITNPRRTIVSKDKTTAYDHVWVYKSSAAASTLIARLDIHQAADYELEISNLRLHGGWPGSGAAPTTSNASAIEVYGYREFRLKNFYATATNWANANQTWVLTDRSNGIVRGHNNDLTIIDGYTVENNRAVEGLVVECDDGTCLAEYSRIKCLNQIASGSNINAMNLAGLSWRDSYISGSNAGPNLLVKAIHIYNVHLSDITDKGIDTTEGLMYPDSIVVENCSFVNCDDNGLGLGGRFSAARGNYFLNCGVGASGNMLIAAAGTAPAALESVTDAKDVAWGDWVSNKHLPATAIIEGNTFGGGCHATGVNIAIHGSDNIPIVAYVTGADNENPSVLPPNCSVRIRSATKVVLGGVFRQGVETIVDFDGGSIESVLEQNAELHPPSGAHSILISRASSTLFIPNPHIVWNGRRVPALAASHYDIAKDANPGTMASLRAYGQFQPTVDPALATVDIPIFRNGVWMYLTTANTDLTLIPGPGRMIVKDTAALTAARTITLSTVGVVAGSEVEYSCSTTGGFNRTFTVGPTNLAAGQWAKFVYNGSSWQRMFSGSV